LERAKEGNLTARALIEESGLRLDRIVEAIEVLVEVGAVFGG